MPPGASGREEQEFYTTHSSPIAFNFGQKSHESHTVDSHIVNSGGKGKREFVVVKEENEHQSDEDGDSENGEDEEIREEEEEGEEGEDGEERKEGEVAEEVQEVEEPPSDLMVHPYLSSINLVVNWEYKFLISKVVEKFRVVSTLPTAKGLPVVDAHACHTVGGEGGAYARKETFASAPDEQEIEKDLKLVAANSDAHVEIDFPSNTEKAQWEWLRGAAQAYLRKAVDLIDNTDTLVLKHPNSPGPVKNGCVPQPTLEDDEEQDMVVKQINSTTFLNSNMTAISSHDSGLVFLLVLALWTSILFLFNSSSFAYNLLATNEHFNQINQQFDIVNHCLNRIEGRQVEMLVIKDAEMALNNHPTLCMNCNLKIVLAIG
ncbi:hypothetical protein EDD15DRAFT_2191639 [Pisolithus albus]|nr:hypothetical protein EDD15DRAFT_2191639 [Pisolithus albus]